MILSELYNSLFPIGGVDNNNRYVTMKSEELSTVQLLEPTISVDEMLILDKDRVLQNDQYDRMSFRIPLVAINGHLLKQENIYNFYVDYSSFVPNVMVEFIDLKNELLSSNSIKDGSIIQIYIGGTGDELYYKPIRQDFIVTNITKINGGNQNEGDWIQYRLTGSLNVPMGHRKDSWSNAPATSTQELFNLAVYTGLGFATNFTYTTIDSMQWINGLGGTFFNFMKNIAEHACYSPNTFFTAFVDQYYVLNFVECHSLLSHGGDKTDTPMMIYSNYQQSSIPSVDKSENDGVNKNTSDQIHYNKDIGEKDYMNNSQKLSYYYISNHHFFKGWSNYIESYNEISNGYSSMDSGYRQHLVYSDSNSGGFGSNVEYIIPPIDNLLRDESTQQINALPDEPTFDSYIPINLMQMNNPQYTEDNLNGVDKMSEVESYIDLGEVDTSNMFRQYYFAEYQNRYQMSCMKKCGIRVVLENYNPAITKYSRIWVDIYDMNPTSTLDLAPSSIPSSMSSTTNENDYKEYIKWKNSKIIYNPDEGVFEGQPLTTANEEQANNTEDSIENTGASQNSSKKEEEKKKNTNYPMGNYNRSLSGWYVVTEFKIVYDNYKKNLKSHLVLNRIEQKPTYKENYYLAKKAVDKYREENRVESIFKNIDDYSY